MDTESGADRRRWVVLAVGLIATTAGCAFQFGLAYLIPALRADGLSLSEAGTLVACPTAGLLVTLIAWGAATDRWGERIVLGTGLGLAGLVLLAGAAIGGGPVSLGACLFVAGAAGASVHASSGRLILGWFSARERGLAMGVRQTAQPLGVAVAALVLPSLGAGGPGGPLVFLGGSCCGAAALVAVAVRDPARPAVAGGGPAPNPYRTPVLWRIHAASALLVVPQFTVATFALVFLVDEDGWPASTAGRVLAAAQVGGAASRLLAGAASDRLGARLGPMRVLAVTIGGVMAALGAVAAGGPGVAPLATAVLLAALVVTVSTNGLAFTAVAEHAGNTWAGRALGIQNTAQNAFAAATPPGVAAAVDGCGYPVTFATVAVFPLVASVLIPVFGERRERRESRESRPEGAPALPRLSRHRCGGLAPHRTSCQRE